MRLRGIEPPHVAPEATALSTELQVHVKSNKRYFNSFVKEEQGKNEKILKNYEDIAFRLLFFIVFAIMYLCLRQHSAVYQKRRLFKWTN